MAGSEKSRKKGDAFWRAAWFLAPYRGLVLISISTAFLTGLIMTSGVPAMVAILRILITGKTVKQLVDEMIQNHQGPIPLYLQYLSKIANLMPADPVKSIAVIFLFTAIIALIGNVIRYFYEYCSDKAAICGLNDVRRKLYDHVLHIPLSFFGLKGTSDVTSRLVSDCQILQEGLKTCLGQSMLEVVRAAFAIVLAVIIDWRLTMFILIFIPFTGIVIKKFGKKTRRASRAALQTSSALLGQIEGSLSGIRVVKAASAERFERRRFASIVQKLLAEQLKLSRLDALSTPVLETIAMWGAGCVLIFATYLMFGDNVKNKLDLAWFMALMVALVTLAESIRKLSKLNSVLQRSSAAAARVFEAMDVPIERPRRQVLNGHPVTPLRVLPPIQREVRFEGVTFTYPNSSNIAVNSVDLAVPRGKSVAIVGRNGSGKTTLMAMLPRFYDPELGRVSIDGMDIRKATLRTLRDQIGIVTQDSVIFPGTISENIAYGLPRKTQEQIEAAARRAFAHDFIMEKPNGYQTSLDGLGGQLSGGQKQRLNIARAILRHAPILILDEATSQVDAESEHLIQQAIESLMHECTTFVIAHRFSTIHSADSIVVMDRGRIVGQGKHEELMKTCETYQQLYERQLGPA